MPPDKARCPSCKAWNSATDERNIGGAIMLSEVKPAASERIVSGPWDECWGGGLVRTSTTLIGGSPGAGKSTLLLQIADAIAGNEPQPAVYIAAEEALAEIKDRADRLKIDNQRSIRMVPAMGGGMNIAEILEATKPCLIILDSLQGFAGDDDALAIEICGIMKKFSTQYKAPSVIISHVNKEGGIAGLMTLQHAVDTLFTFFPDEEDGVRVLNVLKNRNGRAYITSEYEMTAIGLVPALPRDEDEDEDDES
jgi:DNA repair protein RadA/Sms